MTIIQVSGRLAQDTSTMKSLFTISVENINTFSAMLMNNAQGTANFQVFENNQKEIQMDVTAGQNVSYTPKTPGSRIDFYVNYYNGTDLPEVITTWA